MIVDAELFDLHCWAFLPILESLGRTPQCDGLVVSRVDLSLAFKTTERSSRKEVFFELFLYEPAGWS